MMKNSGLIIVMWSVLGLVCPVPRRKKSDTIQSFIQRTGEAIAVNDLLKKYEREHQKLYNDEITDGTVLQWRHLGNKDLSTFCRKYLQHSVPTRTTDNAIGTSLIKTLYYEKENTSITSKIIIVQCNIFLDNNIKRSYYMTRNAKPNCVYALKNSKYEKVFSRFTIINEFCDFEDKPYRILKQKNVGIVDKLHRITGQPIAKKEYLLEFELEHQDLVKKDGQGGNYIGWPHAVLHTNLDSYCYQYMRECMPHRNRDGITGSWNPEKLHYQKLSKNEDIQITIVSCVTMKLPKLYYRVTRAPENNCVFAVLRAGKGHHGSTVIVFKHCDFEEPNIHKTISQDMNIVNRNVTPKTEVKEDLHESLEILLLPNN